MSKKISRRNRRIRNVLLVISMMMVVAMASVGVTVAWLTDSTDAIENTFTAGNIDITLSESGAVDGKKDFEMVPGNVLTKDPTVTVLANSEACYLFVTVEETIGDIAKTEDTKYTVKDYLDYSIDSAWTKLEDGVYYRTVASSNADQPFTVLTGNTVTVKSDVTKAMMDPFFGDNAVAMPKITFKAYACQSANIEGGVTAAWDEVSGN